MTFILSKFASWVNRQRKKSKMEAWVQLNALIGMGESFVGFFENKISGGLALVTSGGVILLLLKIELTSEQIWFWIPLIILFFFLWPILFKGLVVGRWLEHRRIMQENAKYATTRNPQIMEILKTIKRIDKKLGTTKRKAKK